jgi:hypothetical protein
VHTFSHGVWDTPRNRLVVQGGTVARGADFLRTADLWELVPGTPPAWTSLMPNLLPPPAGTGFAAAIDTTGDRVILYGGSGSTDTWSRTLAANEGWLRVGTSGPVGSTRTGAADLAGARMLALATYPAAIDAFDFVSDVWQPLPSPSPPHARGGPFVAFDDVHRRFYLSGGVYTDFSTGQNVYLDDTWEYNVGAGTWQALASAGSFGSVFGAAGIHDPLRNRLIAFAGQDSFGYVGVLQQLALGAGGTWIPLTAMGTPPPPDDDYQAVYDPVGDRMIVFGSGVAGSIRVWALALAEPASWSLFSPAGRLPFSRRPEQAVYDAKRKRILLHGGQYAYGFANDTWAFYLDDTTPALLSLVDALVESDRVVIRWYSGEPVSGAATVLRRVDRGEFAAVADILQDGSGMFTYEDRDLAGGRRFDYKLRVGGHEFGEVTATMPASAGLRLLGPNPCIGELRVAFDLPGRAPARIELYDVSGRRVLERNLDGLGEGGHVLSLARQAPGIYFVRLVQAGQVIVRKVVIAG